MSYYSHKRAADARRTTRLQRRERLYANITAKEPKVADCLTAAQVQALVWAINSKLAARRAELHGADDPCVYAEYRVTVWGGISSTTMDALVAKGLMTRTPPVAGYGTYTEHDQAWLTAKGRAWARRLEALRTGAMQCPDCADAGTYGSPPQPCPTCTINISS